MNDLFALISYCLVAVFGIFLAVEFCGVRIWKEALPKLLIFTALSLAAQGLCYAGFGLDFTKQAYPLILHLPLVCFLVLGCKKSWTAAAVSVLLAYLCCQIPRWISSVTYLFSEDSLYYHILYVAVVPVVYALLRRFAAKPMQKIMTRSPRSVWGLGIFPLLYYIFDYATTVYTDALYSGNPYVAQIMPSVMSVCYILFALIYQAQLEAQEDARQEHFLLSLQLRRSQAEFDALRQMQDQANRFHHDLRHHTALLLDYAEKGDMPEIKAYLKNMRQELDTVPLKRFCGHPVVDLVLSHFESQAAEAGVRLAVTAELPAALPFKDTELCSMLSNGLENAIHAAARAETEKTVTVSLSVRQKNLLLSIQNPYAGEVTIVDGLPLTKRTGHGLGTRSIATIVHQHGGLVHFSAADGQFLLRATLPMD